MTKPHILLVDDDRLVLATLSDGLRQYGFEVLTAASGEQALAMFKDQPPDLALLDIRMPGMSGIEVARHLKQQGRVPFMFLTAYSDDEVVRQATEEGALGYLVKPVDVAQVAPALRTALARAHDLATLRANGDQMQQALTQNRETSMAIGLVMGHYHFTRDQAFEALRTHARSQRRKVEEVATELLAAAEQLSLPVAVLERAHSGKG